jgi:hypothetical protein
LEIGNEATRPSGQVDALLEVTEHLPLGFADAQEYFL